MMYTHAYAAHAHQRLDLHLPSPGAVTRHALAVLVERFVVLNKRRVRVALELHVRHQLRAQSGVVAAGAVQLVAGGSEEAVAVGIHVRDA